MLLKTLKADGHTCEEAEDGKQAVEKVKADLDKFHVILMDFVMPVMDGPDATKAIRDLGYTRPIIGCTGNTMEMDVKRFSDSGCKYVIGKPFDSNLFYTHIADHDAAAESGRSVAPETLGVVPFSALSDEIRTASCHSPVVRSPSMMPNSNRWRAGYPHPMRRGSGQQR
jgi:CheY-like chemotaxis protein